MDHYSVLGNPVPQHNERENKKISTRLFIVRTRFNFWSFLILFDTREKKALPAVHAFNHMLPIFEQQQRQ